MMKNLFSPLNLLGRFTVGRFFIFRKELALLWRGFRHADTPLALKFAMLLVPLYLISPVDLIPDMLPFAGIVDDMIIVPLLVSWIVGILPLEVRGEKARAGARASRPSRSDVIDGTARRL